MSTSPGIIGEAILYDSKEDELNSDYMISPFTDNYPGIITDEPIGWYINHRLPCHNQQLSQRNWEQIKIPVCGHPVCSPFHLSMYFSYGDSWFDLALCKTWGNFSNWWGVDVQEILYGWMGFVSSWHFFLTDADLILVELSVWVLHGDKFIWKTGM